MDEKELLGEIFEKIPQELAREVLMMMDMGNTLYVCARNESVDGRLCTENFWKRKVGKFYGKKEKIQLETWKNIALELYLRSQEEECLECGRIAVDECTRCADERGEHVPLCEGCVFHDDCSGEVCGECHEYLLENR